MVSFSVITICNTVILVANRDISIKPSIVLSLLFTVISLLATMISVLNEKVLSVLQIVLSLL